MAWALVENGVIKATYNNPKPITINGIQHPRNIFTVWSKDQKKALGIYDIEVVQGEKLDYTTQSESITYDSQNDKVVKTISWNDQPVESVKSALKTKVENKRDAVIKSGVMVNIANTSVYLQTSKDPDLQNIIAVGSSGTALVATGANTALFFRDANNVTHSLTPTEAVTMALTAQSKISGVWSYSWGLKENVEAAVSIDDLRAIDVEAGWPDPTV